MLFHVYDNKVRLKLCLIISLICETFYNTVQLFECQHCILLFLGTSHSIKAEPLRFPFLQFFYNIREPFFFIATMTIYSSIMHESEDLKWITIIRKQEIFKCNWNEFFIIIFIFHHFIEISRNTQKIFCIFLFNFTIFFKKFSSFGFIFLSSFSL